MTAVCKKDFSLLLMPKNEQPTVTNEQKEDPQEQKQSNTKCDVTLVCAKKKKVISERLN